MRARNEGSVFQLANGKWRAQIGVGGGRYVTRTAATQDAAVKLLRKLHAEADTGVVTRGDITLGDLIDEWLELDQPDSDRVLGTRLSNVSHLNAWRAELGSRRITKIGVVDLERALRDMNDRRGKPYGRNTMTKRRSLLGQVYEAAIRRGHTTFNPARSIRLPRDTSQPKQRRALDAKQAERIIRTTAKRRNGTAYLVGLSLGLRPGELLGLCWDCIDFTKGTLRVQRGIRMNHGRPELVDDLKTSASLRPLAMPDYVSTALKEHRASQRKERLAAAEWDDNDLVFPGPAGRPIDPKDFRNTFQSLCASLGYGNDWTPNEMRHTAASLLSARGVPLEDIADLLGHTTTRMLERHYRHATKPAHDGHVAAMQTMFGKAARAK